MKGRERLLSVLNQRRTDRIPVAPFIHVNYVKEFFEDHDVDCIEATSDVYRHFGFDLVHRNCSVAYDHLAAVETPQWKVDVFTECDGRDETKTTVVRTPGGEIRQVLAIRWTCEYDCEVSLVEFPIKERRDLELCQTYMPPVRVVDTSPIKRAKQVVGDEGIVAPWIQGVFNEASFWYRKLDDLLLDALSDPEFYTDLMNFVRSRLRDLIRPQIEAGAEALSAGGNVANGKLVGPDFFRQHVAPYEQELIDFVQRNGSLYLYHNCGYADCLLDIYPSLGMKIYESLTPPPYGDTSLAKALETFDPSRTTLQGNIDQITLLRKGSTAEIEEAVRETLERVRAWDGCFVLGTTDYFNENTPRRNIEALAEAGLRHGRY